MGIFYFPFNAVFITYEIDFSKLTAKSFDLFKPHWVQFVTKNDFHDISLHKSMKCYQSPWTKTLSGNLPEDSKRPSKERSRALRVTEPRIPQWIWEYRYNPNMARAASSGNS